MEERKITNTEDKTSIRHALYKYKYRTFENMIGLQIVASCSMINDVINRLLDHALHRREDGGSVFDEPLDGKGLPRHISELLARVRGSHEGRYKNSRQMPAISAHDSPNT